ncbi:MAG: hypothetical protein EPO32_13985 [Anaerolineae bacterium]|nr:MAG: hypothetical protein EPO32_13985 [Anaerolineae bacterium]
MKRLMLVGAILLAGALALGWQTQPALAVEPQQDDLVARGEYLVYIAGCVGCHTPLLPDSFEIDTSRLFAGGVPFELGPLGVVFTKNLTADVETGLGGWTDEEIKTAIKTGVSRDGLHLFPIMPYTTFMNMADADVDAIVAYLRTVPAVNNAVPRTQILPPEALPQLPYLTGIVAPEPSDTAARGQYLLTSVIACTDCHTPVNPETGAPLFEQYLSGGQPFEGPWGIVYGGNITPHETTGIGSWTDDEIERVIREGVRPDNRVVVLMPTMEFSHLTDDDVAAIIHYLRNDVQPVERLVPEAALNEGFLIYAEPEATGGGPASPVVLGVVIVALLLIVGVGVAQSNKKKTAG